MVADGGGGGGGVAFGFGQTGEGGTTTVPWHVRGDDKARAK